MSQQLRRLHSFTATCEHARLARQHATKGREHCQAFLNELPANQVARLARHCCPQAWPYHVFPPEGKAEQIAGLLVYFTP